MKYLGVKREGNGIVAWQFLSTQLQEYARADHTHTNFNNLSIGNRLSFGDFGLQFSGGNFPSLTINHSATGDIMTARKYFVDFWKNFDIQGNTIKGLPTPTADDHAASKEYVDTKFSEVSSPTSGMTQSQADGRYARRDHLHDITDVTGAISQEVINDEFDKLKSEIETLKQEIATLKENSGRVKNDRTNRYLDVWVGPEAIKPDSTNKLVFVEKE